MARPYNFLQFVSGFLGVGGSFFSANPNFENFLTGSGLYTPLSMLGQKINYIWVIAHDDEYFPAFYSSAFSGVSQSSNLNSLSYIPSFSGNYLPVSSGVISFCPSVSGTITGAIIDSPIFSIPFSGALSGIIYEIPQLIIKFSGAQVKRRDDTSDIGLSFSGSQSGISIDIPIYGVSFTGGLVKYVRDSCIIDVALDTITWIHGYPSDRQSISGQCLIDINLDKVFFRGESLLV